MKTTTKMKMTSKIKTATKMKMTQKNEDNLSEMKIAEDDLKNEHYLKIVKDYIALPCTAHLEWSCRW